MADQTNVPEVPLVLNKQERLLQASQLKQQALANKPNPLAPPPVQEVPPPASVREMLTRGIDANAAQASTGNAASEARGAQESKMWVDDAGMRTPSGSLVNSVAAMVEIGAPQLASQIMGALPTATSALQLRGVPDAAIESYNKQLMIDGTRKELEKQRRLATADNIMGTLDNQQYLERMNFLDQKASEIPTLSKEENALLDVVVQQNEGPRIDEFSQEDTSAPAGKPITYRTKLDSAVSSLKSSGEIDKFFMDSGFMDGVFNDIDRKQQTSEISTAWNVQSRTLDDAQAAFDKGNYGKAALEGVSAVTNLLVDGGAAIATNPGASFEWAMQNAPQLMLGLFGKAALATSNVAYGLDAYRRGLEAYQAENNGALPDKSTQGDMLLSAMAAAGVEQLADSSLLRGLGIGKKAKPGIPSVKQALMGAVTKPLKSVASEGTTEGVQNVFEQLAEGKSLSQVDAGQVYENTVIGGAAGGGTTIVPNVLGSAKDAATAPLKRRAIEVAKTKAEQAVKSAEINTEIDASLAGDTVSPITKSTNEGDNPSKFALTDVIDTIAARHVETTNATADSPSNVAEGARLVSVAKATFSQALDDYSTLLGERDSLQKQIDSSATPSQEDTARLKQLDAELSSLDSNIETSRTSLKQLIADQDSLTSTEESVNTVSNSTERNQAFTVAAQQIIGKTLGSLESVTVDQVKQVLGSTLLNDQERNQLEAYVNTKEAIDAAKNLDQVSQQVLVGGTDKSGKRYTGAEEYRQQVASAVELGDTRAAEQAANNLRAFVKRHVQKAKALSTAYAPYQREADTYEYKPTAQEQKAQAYVDKNYTTLEGKPLKIDGGSGRLVQAVAYEANALRETLKEVEVILGNSVTAPKTEATTVVPDANQETTAAPQPPIQTNEQTVPSVQEATNDPLLNENTVVNDSNSQSTSTQVDTNAVSDTNTNTVETLVSETVSVEEDMAQSPKERVLEQNQVARNFKVKLNPKNILQNVEGFITKLAKEGADFVMPFTKLNTLDAKQIEALQHFASGFASAKAMLEGLFKDDQKFRYADYIRYLTDGNGNLQPTVVEAIYSGVYTWVATQGRNAYFNERDAVANMFGIHENQLSEEVYRAFETAGMSRSELARRLGAEIRRNLGLELDKSAAENHQARLEQSLGNHAIALLSEMGMIEEHTVTMQDFEIGDINLPMVRIATNEDGSVAAAPAEIVKANSGTKNIVGQLFESEMVQKRPSLTAPETQVGRQKGTRKRIAMAVQRILGRHGSRPHQIAGDTDSVFNLLNRDMQEEMLGVLSDGEIDSMHESRQEGARGKNEALRRELDGYNEWRSELETEGDIETPFYLEHEVWRNQRVGMSNDLVNPQRSKVHRGLVRMKSWVAKINPSNKEDMKMFWLGFGQSLGVDIDKLTEADAVEQAKAKFADPIIAAGVGAIMDSMDGATLNEEMKRSIVDAVKKGGEGTHTLHALTNMARYQMAGGKPFVSDMTIEVDGITNGVMIGAMQFMPSLLPEKLDSILAGGGIFTDGTRSYGEYKKNGGLDNYERLAMRWHNAVQKLVQSTRDPQYAKSITTAANFLQLVKDGKPNRKLAKDPLMTNVYGAGNSSIKGLVATKFFDAVLDRIENIVKSDETDAVKMTQLKELETELTSITGKPLVQFKSNNPDHALRAKFNPTGQKAITEFLNDTIGTSVLSAIKEDFGVFMQNRKVFNALIQSQNEMFIKMFQARVKQMTEILVESGELSDEYETLPRDKMNEIIEELKEVAPQLNTIFTDNADENIQLANQLTGSTREKTHTVQTSFNGRSSITSYGSAREWKAALGVGPAIIGIHSIDASIALALLREVGVLNVHDGFVVGIKEAKKTSKILNNRFRVAMKRYSLITEARKNAQRALQAAQDFNNLVELGMHEHEFTNLAKNITTISKLEELVAPSLDQLNKDIQYATQYNLEEGGSLNTEYKPKEPKIEATTSEWGEINHTNESAPSNTHAEQYLRQAEDITVGGLVDAALNSMDKRSARAKMLMQLGRILGSDLKIVLVDPETQLDVGEKTANALKGAHAIYEPNSNTVYFKSTKFTHHGMSDGTIVHELVHAALSRLIQSTKPGENAAIDALENLRQIVALKMMDNPNIFAGEREQMVKNVDEFVAYALSHETFQSYLSKIELKRGNRVVTAFKSFVKAIQRAVFGSTSETQTNVLAEIIEEAAQVMADAQRYNVANMEYSAAPQETAQMTSAQILEALGLRDTLNPRSEGHKDHLQNVQSSIVSVLAGAQGATLRERENQLGDDADQFLRHLINKTNPFVSELVGRFTLSAQEAYVAEQVEAVLGELMNEGSFQVKQLQRIYDIAREDAGIKAALTEEQWDFIFNPRTTSVTSGYNALAGKRVTHEYSNYLQRFTALALTHEPLRSAMNDMNVNEQSLPIRGKSFGKQIEAVWHNLLAMLRQLIDRAGKVEGSANNRVERILTNLATIESRKRQRVLRERLKTEHPADGKLNRMLQQGITKVRKLAENQRQNSIARAVNVAAKLQEFDTAAGFMDVIQQTRNKITQKRNGLVMSLVQELRGETEGNSRFMKLLRWSNRDIDQARRAVKEHMSQLIKEGFAEELTKENSEALTRSIVMTDFVSLLDHMDIVQAEILLTDPTARDFAINELETQLAQTEYGMYYINQADALGRYMAEGYSSNPMLTKNAHGIVRLFGRSETASAADIALAEPLIEQLATLRAMQYTSAGDIALATEMFRNDRTGVQIAINHHKALKADALASAFGGDKSLMAKGYTYEITNPHKSIAWAEVGSDDAALLRAQGYQLHHTTQFKYDRGNRKAMGVYIIHDGGSATYMAATMSFTNNSAKGTTLANALADGDGKVYYSIRDQQDSMAAQRERDTNILMNQRVPAGDVSEIFAIPVFNPNGEAVDFRMEMIQKYRQSALEKDYRLEMVLGGEAGNLVDKQASEAVNRDTIEALAEAYRGDTDREGYVAIHKRSDDARLKEIWDMLPDQAKRVAREKFGGDRIMIRREMLDLVFGYRKFSVLDTLKMPAAERNMVQKMTAKALELAMRYFGIKAASRIHQVEQVWQEVIRAVKDILVVKNLFTLVGNIVSNMALLSLSGVPFRDIIKNQAVAWKGVQDYQRDQAQLFKLERTVAAQPLTADQLSKFQADIAILKQRIAANPVAELVEAGLFQTIVEDIDTADDPYSYKTKMFEKLDGYTSFVPKGMKDAAKVLTMSHDTAVYKFMNQSTQISDFAARYVQFKHYTERAKNPLSKEEALSRVVENFVNYDIPTHKAIQYLNDMGLVMFTKYYMRIQKPLIKLVRENPARFIYMLLAQSMLGFSAPSDSSFLANNPMSRFVNPLDTAIGAPDEIVFINAILHGTGIK